MSEIDVARWKRFVSELPERIARLRLEDAPPLCPTCGSTTPAVVDRKTCSACRQELPMSAFYRNRTHRDGRDSYCRDCRRVVRAAQWLREKRRAAGVERMVS